MTAALSMQGVCKQYEDFRLQDIDLTLPTGQIMGLVGVNGAGKSTLLRLLMGLVRADRGEVEVFGQRLPEAQVAVKRDIGYASDDMRLYPGQTLRWHMDFIRGIYPGWDEAYAQDLVKRFDLKPQQKLGGTSHGQRVKALLLLMLARHPRLLLLDEPTTGLDPVARGEVLEALGYVLRDEERSVLFSSHNTADIEQLADSITFLHAGRIVASEDKETFLDRWRRVVCQGEPGDALRALPGLHSLRHSAPIVELKTGAYNDSLAATLATLGLMVTSVEPMSLEDIFVTTVRGGGKA
ncbi:ABC transporter ATP-binding protein YtrB [Planctomycetes bacterium Poly30]|uniref:ABC transporter ATP-binding protein YtrB n=1 Tax=Saltatorellus ferox TaxID=2528018 RepID=A0A518ETT0_9BACT|nr:ABC transporter ATP-binding protein YtrB [Planctomycetes bacterium Poly30]